jgi:Domain of unknown function (DUF4126)
MARVVVQEGTMETVAFLGRTLGFSLAAGVNLYATVAILGLASRFSWVELPPEYAVFDNNWIIGSALVLYVVEFFADKIPWVDTLWDSIHTVIRPIGGALIAVATLGDASPTVEGLVAVLGGTVAAGSHLTKAGTRVVTNSSPEPISNWFLSLSEDLFVIGLGYLALKHPVAALVVSIAVLAVILLLMATLIRAIRRRLLAVAPPVV